MNVCLCLSVCVSLYMYVCLRICVFNVFVQLSKCNYLSACCKYALSVRINFTSFEIGQIIRDESLNPKFKKKKNLYMLPSTCSL